MKIPTIKMPGFLDKKKMNISYVLEQKKDNPNELFLSYRFKLKKDFIIQTAIKVLKKKFKSEFEEKEIEQHTDNLVMNAEMLKKLPVQWLFFQPQIDKLISLVSEQWAIKHPGWTIFKHELECVEFVEKQKGFYDCLLRLKIFVSGRK